MAAGENFYIVYFQQPGVAEANLERDVRSTMRRALIGASGDAKPGQGWNPVLSTEGFVDDVAEPEALPAWLTEADIDFYTQEFERTGYTGGLNWYRAMDRTWELMAPWTGAKVTPPALFIAGTRDAVLGFPGMDGVVKNQKDSVPNLRGAHLIDGAGHWVQQERPAEVNAALIEFLRGL
jgi:pimeloyl-ACP methyl ester carboxylesterase